MHLFHSRALTFSYHTARTILQLLLAVPVPSFLRFGKPTQSPSKLPTLSQPPTGHLSRLKQQQRRQVLFRRWQRHKLPLPQKRIFTIPRNIHKKGRRYRRCRTPDCCCVDPCLNDIGWHERVFVYSLQRWSFLFTRQQQP